MNWPSNSPDLNPIENFWSILKRCVEKHVNKLLAKKNSITIDVFLDIIQKEWEGIEDKIFINLICSMPSRLKQVIESDSNKISY